MGLKGDREVANHGEISGSRNWVSRSGLSDAAIPEISGSGLNEIAAPKACSPGLDEVGE